MKMQLTATSNRVALEYDDAYEGRRVTREFMVPHNGGYVREWIGNDWTQVCDRLAHRGSTLMCAEGKLPALIRSEYRKMRRAEAALDARFA